VGAKLVEELVMELGRRVVDGLDETLGVTLIGEVAPELDEEVASDVDGGLAVAELYERSVAETAEVAAELIASELVTAELISSELVVAELIASELATELSDRSDEELCEVKVAAAADEEVAAVVSAVFDAVTVEAVTGTAPVASSSKEDVAVI
jgi:hypothetical protein